MVLLPVRLMLLTVLATALGAAEVVLVDGRIISGTIRARTAQAVDVQSGTVIQRVPAQAIHAIYPDAAALAKAKATEPFFVLQQPFASISLEREAALQALEDRLLAIADADARQRAWLELPAATRALMPGTAALAAWLRPTRATGDAEPVPWAKGNPRAIVRIHAPAQPATRALGLIIALHGTEDDPEAIASVMASGVRGRDWVALAPRTTQGAFWSGFALWSH